MSLSALAALVALLLSFTALWMPARANAAASVASVLWKLAHGRAGPTTLDGTSDNDGSGGGQTQDGEAATTDDSKSSGSGPPIAIIAGISSVVVMGILVGCVVYLRKYRAEQRAIVEAKEQLEVRRKLEVLRKHGHTADVDSIRRGARSMSIVSNSATSIASSLPGAVPSSPHSPGRHKRKGSHHHGHGHHKRKGSHHSRKDSATPSVVSDTTPRGSFVQSPNARKQSFMASPAPRNAGRTLSIQSSSGNVTPVPPMSPRASGTQRPSIRLDQ